ncbi:hypothetical protein VTK73DRAFT_9684 [Phialemonium thermophilum]|uniref:C2H2-type domain-containing protein n=1 Tax=Phialemonium thermophilum TaxID=223376 RepID=A0ABR3W1A0_9PEZI
MFPSYPLRSSSSAGRLYRMREQPDTALTSRLPNTSDTGSADSHTQARLSSRPHSFMLESWLLTKEPTPVTERLVRLSPVASQSSKERFIAKASATIAIIERFPENLYPGSSPPASHPLDTTNICVTLPTQLFVLPCMKDKMPSTRRSSRRSEREKNRSSASSTVSQDPDLATILKQFSQTLMMKLDAKTEENWPEAYDDYLVCPFRRRNPARYASVLDYACTGYGFKEIADLRDHIKRVHSYKYGCFDCKERYQGRDNNLAAQIKKHKAECRNAGLEPAKVKHFRPEWMTPEQDRRYFKLDFRKSVGLTVESQYIKICESLWPEFDARGLNIWSKPGDMVAKCDVADVLDDPDLYGQFVSQLSKFLGDKSSSGSGYRQSSGHGQMANCYAADTAQPMLASGHYIDPSAVEAAAADPSFFDPPYQTSYQYGSWQPGELGAQGDDDVMNTHTSLEQLTHIPKPTQYTVAGTKDSAYWSMGVEDRQMDVMMDMPNGSSSSSSSSSSPSSFQTGFSSSSSSSSLLPAGFHDSMLAMGGGGEYDFNGADMQQTPFPDDVYLI